MEDKLIESIAYILPAAVTGFVAYYIFNRLIIKLSSDEKIALLSQRKKEALPIKLQAYERMLLFCERINPVKMLVRIKPITEDTQDYLQLLIANIDQEFEHNLVQQMYITDDSWTAVVATKNTIINKLRQVAETAKTANELRENVIIDYSKTLPPTDTVISIIKNEVKKLL
ncbi:hypothetical protein [Polaribacter sp. HaHaR_3_91]|jgi:hypothetical protein|uniref:DUF7935 family protein n=1 Tax=Polaribacter sp. HaHaR_3_91 TaxID=2745561 RepID=UPI001C5000CA|nr:hypothetical protein [Polaribacter sp. HaHaR_3_91]QXP62167.1 hypothetical protein H0I27_09725 [Polaribacter sp. HaHaR_3_91]